jgi:hypothetical protein
MTPTIDERLASVVRSLSEVVLPHLPPEASLAQEQVHLAVGHLQILRAQLDAAPAFEREELDDAKGIGLALAEAVPGTEGSALRATIDSADGSNVRGQYQAINDSVAVLVSAVYAKGEEAERAAVSRIILEHEHPRVQKDRRWLLPFGFDSGI